MPGLSTADVAALLAERGMLLESARGPIDNIAQLVAGEPIAGSWWGHPAGKLIFNTINDIADSPDVVRLRLVDDKITHVHRRVWPALAKLADRIPAKRLVAVSEEHTSTGAHRKVEVPFPEWMPLDALAGAEDLTDDAALAMLPQCVGPRPRQT